MSLKGKRIAILAGPEYEDLELHYPHLRLTEEGAEVKVMDAKKRLNHSDLVRYCISRILTVLLFVDSILW